MSRRALPALALFLLFCGTAAAQTPPADFRARAGKQVWDVARFSPPSFWLANGEGSAFALYSEIPGQYVPVQCERSAAYRLIAFANEAGALIVGVCKKETNRLGALSAAAGPALDALIAELFRGRAQPTAAERAQRGLDYVRRSAPDGAQEHAFPVLLVGHGIIPVETFILVPPAGERAVIVQANVYKLCQDFGPKLNTPLCSNTRQALGEIARRIAALP